MRHSVIIPAHNAVRYIADCLNSVLPQLSADDEVIIVDDGSSDGTLDLVRAIPDSRIVVGTHPRNLGAAAARNTAMGLSSGGVIHFLDADDLWAPDHMAVARELLTRHPECSVFSGWVVHFHCPLYPPLKAKSLPPPQAAALPGSIFMLRQTMEAAGPIDTSLSSGEFIDYVVRIRRTPARWLKSDSVFFHRRLHQENHSRADRDRASAYLEVVRRQLRSRSRP